MKTVSIVVPLFNEADGLRSFHAALQRHLAGPSYEFHVMYVNDGSADRTGAVLAEIAKEDPRVSFLTLSRNFGHQAALTAGLEHVDGDIVISMDGDGQHPPQLIPEMLRLHENGFDIVQTQRLPGPESPFKRWTASSFYWLINRIGESNIPAGAADFRLLSREALEAFRGIREYHRFLRGITSWMGFRSVLLPYEANERLAGASQYSLRKMIRLAAAGLFSFSLLPLRIGLLLGSLFIVLAAVEIVYVSVFWIFGHRAGLVPGWSSLIIITTLGNGIMMILLGFVGVYVGMIFQEVKRRPVYLLKPSLCHFAKESPALISAAMQDPTRFSRL